MLAFVRNNFLTPTRTMNTRNKLTALFTAFAVLGAAYTHAQEEAKPVAGVFRLQAIYTDGGYDFVKHPTHTAYAYANSGSDWELAPSLELGALVNGKHEFTLSADIASFSNTVTTSFEPEGVSEDFDQLNILGHYRYLISKGKLTTSFGVAAGFCREKLGGDAFSESQTSVTYGADLNFAYNFAKGWSLNAGVRYMLRKQDDFNGQLGDNSGTGGANSTFPTFDKIGTVGSLGFNVGLGYRF